jgi:hypothetical protein
MEPNCWKRKCKHYLGIIQPDGTELTERNACKAFPDGIPYEIAYGDNKHEIMIEGQERDYVFERD